MFTYPSTKALLPPSRVIASVHFSINASLGMLIGQLFFGSSNCRWQNGSSATSAVLVEALVEAATLAIAFMQLLYEQTELTLAINLHRISH